MASAPPLPRRPEHSTDADGVPDEAPPPYEATPATNAEQTLEYGPTRPFQPPPTLPPRHPPPSQQHAPPPGPPPGDLSPAPTGASVASTSASLPPPQFPFWNGATLTGFSEGRFHPVPTGPPPPSHTLSPAPPPPQPPQHTGPAPSPRLPPRPNGSSPDARGGTSGGGGYNPTETPTPGQPLLHQGKLLVYPVGKDVCYKCSNTGYKPFDPYTGCVDKPSWAFCWQKHGKPYTSALRHSLSPSSPPPPNYQRPLRLLQTPQTRPPPPQVVVGSGYGFGGGPPPAMMRGAGTLVVRPGDPRMGGMLCRRCGGDGLVPGLFLFDEVTCEACRGAGRVFV
ncbi:hypothetical protein Rhopal_002202-T1 [Rhodotorula paludigena]|uniref:Uncharacterized protein n=1 Tax=Rhodotorula paludigena TaxID=86838 RepID=A0AAV5GGE2_9BASI|nr:hypothetical protein Rhopal_002202-T1 [Rhodotorula paludigena]